MNDALTPRKRKQLQVNIFKVRILMKLFTYNKLIDN